MRRFRDEVQIISWFCVLENCSIKRISEFVWKQSYIWQELWSRRIHSSKLIGSWFIFPYMKFPENSSKNCNLLYEIYTYSKRDDLRSKILHT